MIEHVRKVLADIKRVVPDYDPKQGYELAGFVWFQGFNDLVYDWTYDKRMNPAGTTCTANCWRISSAMCARICRRRRCPS